MAGMFLPFSLPLGRQSSRQKKELPAWRGLCLGEHSVALLLTCKPFTLPSLLTHRRHASSIFGVGGWVGVRGCCFAFWKRRTGKASAHLSDVGRRRAFSGTMGGALHCLIWEAGPSPQAGVRSPSIQGEVRLMCMCMCAMPV